MSVSPDLQYGPDGLGRSWGSNDPLLRAYYDAEWGMPVRDERGLFERLSLEAFQSGLSWLTILRKRPGFRAAFADFDAEAVAAFDEADEARLMADVGIVRNRLKVDATIANARAIVALRDRDGLPDLIWSYQPPVTPTPMTWADVPHSHPSPWPWRSDSRPKASASSARPRRTPS